MAATLSMISTISFVVSAISFAVAVFLWFRFKIPSVYGDLSGRTARKSIEQMRANNEKSGAKGFRPSAVNAERGKLTAAMTSQGKSQPKGKKSVTEDERPETGLLSENMGRGYSANETELLSDGATELLSDETELLDGESTVLLRDDGTVPVAQFGNRGSNRRGGKSLVMMDEVVLVHSDVVIDVESFEN